MRISDWSSDVCSSDLARVQHQLVEAVVLHAPVPDAGEGFVEGVAHRREIDGALAFGAHAEVVDPYRRLAVGNVDVERHFADHPQAHVLQHRRSEEHTSELQSLMRISYAVFCLKKQKKNTKTKHPQT